MSSSEILGRPTRIERLPDATAGVSITWDSGDTHTVSCEDLRRWCPCASCKEVRGEASHSKPLSPKPTISGHARLQVLSASKDESLLLEKIWPVGNYAIGMRWGDGHDSGIYTYEYLGQLCTNQQLLVEGS